MGGGSSRLVVEEPIQLEEVNGAPPTERPITQEQRQAAARNAQRATEQYGGLPQHPQQGRLNEIRRWLDNNEPDDMSPEELAHCKTLVDEQAALIQTINSFTASNYEVITDAFLKLAENAAKASGASEPIYGGM